MYHYTSLNAFDQIIRYKNLRMTRAEFLNDPDECSIFFEVIEKYYELEQSRDLFEDAIKAVVNRRHFTAEQEGKLRDIVFREYPLVKFMKDIRDNINFYILSLTTTPDDLAMWNYYGEGGIMFDFDQNKLVLSILNHIKNAWKDDSHNHYIAYGKVKYLDKSKLDNPYSLLRHLEFNKVCQIRFGENQFINVGAIQYIQNNQLIDFLNTYIKNHVESIGNIMTNEPFEGDYFTAIYTNVRGMYDRYEFKKQMQLYLTAMTAFFKPKTFEYEEEARIVCFSDEINYIEFEEYTLAKGFYKPFLNFQIDNLSDCIDSITLSPMFRNTPILFELHAKTINSFVKKELKKDIDVTVSEHSIRW